MEFIRSGNSGASSEMVSSLILHSQGGHPVVVYSLNLNGPNFRIKAGDFLNVRGRVQITTNESTFNTLCSSYIALGTDMAGKNEIKISQAAGKNVTPSVHHDMVSDFGTYQFTGSDLSYHWINFVLSADSTSGVLPLIVEANTGKLSYELYRTNSSSVTGLSLVATIT